MDTPSTLLRPNLRLLRRSSSPGDGDATPQAGPSSAPFLDDESDEFPTPRIHPRPIAEQTPAARLRALLAREPRSPRASTPPQAPPSEADSAVGPPHFGSSASSVARESVRDIFSRALREPGDTPQKGRLRSNSFDGSSMEITPVVARDRAQRRAARQSLSDEEAEKPKSGGRADPSFRLSTAFAFDTLRARLAASRSQLMDQKPPEALYDHSSASASTSHSQHHPQATPSSRVNPQVTSLTPYPSFQMSSQLAFQSNLLEQDSEMQRAMGDVLNSENEGSTPAPNVAQSTTVPDPRPYSSLREGLHDSKSEHGRASNELGSSTSSSPANVVNGQEYRFHSQQEGRSHQQWNRPRFPSRSGTPEVHRRHSQEFRRLSQEFRPPAHAKSPSHEFAMSSSGTAKPVHRHRRGSLASLQSFDDDQSSRPSSIGSQADYRDRISELDKEKNYEREREWNRRHPPSRPSSSLSTSSNHSLSHSHPPRSPSTTPYLTPTHASLQRKSSRTSLRSDSPASLASSHDSLKELEREEEKEVKHERERNWNSPRPHWSTTKSPSTLPLKPWHRDGDSFRASTSLPRLRDSIGYEDTSRVSTKPQNTQSKVDSSTTSPVLVKSDSRSDSALETSSSALGINQSAQSKHSSPGKTPGAVSKFGWNFSRSPLAPLELDDSADHRRSTSPTPGSRPLSRSSEAIISSQIPVRSRMKSFSSVGNATSDMSLTHVIGEPSSFQQVHRHRLNEVVEPQSPREPPPNGSSRSQDELVPGSEEVSIVDLQSTTPRSNPPKPLPEEIETDTDTEILASPSPQGSPRLETSAFVPNEASPRGLDDPPRAQTPDLSPEQPPASATPPGTPPSASPRSQLPTSEESPSFALVTPPRGTSFAGSILDFQTPSPPISLPDLPGPPSSDDDVLGNSPLKDRHDGASLNLTLTKTPKPPGAWAATPVPRHRSSSPTALFPLESTPPAFTSTPLPRASSLPPTRAAAEIDSPSKDELLTPVGGALPRAKSLPLRTPAPPGAWVATPGQSVLLNNGVDQSQYGSLSRRKGLLKVRFDVTESETSATEGHPSSPLTAIRLTNPELPLPELTMDHGADKLTLSTTPALIQRPATPERPTTPISRENGTSPRSLRKSPSVRLVDAYGRERVDEQGAGHPFVDLPNGHVDAAKKASSPPTPRRSLVRIVDAMGREVGDSMDIPDALESKARPFEADISVASDDTPIGHAKALVRMRRTLRDLAESLSDSDRSEDLELDSTHLEQLEEVSRAARLARNQLAHNLHIETEKQHDLRHDDKSSAWPRRSLPVSTKKSWNTTVIYCGVIIQFLFILAVWRYAHAEARRLFYTTYYDPLYPEFTPIHESSCFTGTLSMSRPWTMLDSYETILREGWWSVGKEAFRAMRHVGDQAWERWGENVHFEKPT